MADSLVVVFFVFVADAGDDQANISVGTAERQERIDSDGT
jgi:hypothetical protein